MKWTDKNGKEFEGSVEEYSAWKKLDMEVKWTDGNIIITGTAKEKEQYESLKGAKKQKKSFGGTWISWSKAEKKILKENYKKCSREQLEKLIPNRSIPAIEAYAYKIFHTKRHIPILSEETRAKISSRGTFLCNRANNLMKSDTSMSREKAFSIASMEWKDKQPLGKITATTDKVIYEVKKIDLDTGEETVVDMFNSHIDAKECQYNMEKQYADNNIRYYVKKVVKK